ncbi:MAG TPA: thiamine phosphate synthase [Acidiferrobacter sp.]|nr:thiamine phosphate synthase [Acidiferrobacter sp.]
MRIEGLYALTDSRCCTQQGMGRIAAALDGGVRMLQLRCKSPALTVEYGRQLVSLAHSFGVPVIINDDVELAYAICADGVHLGQDDGSIEEARAVLGAQAIIGVSCYASLAQARDAAARGADYLAFGSFYPSRTKPQAPRATPDVLAAARVFGKPLVAIGGILPENGGALVAAGASALAVIDGIFGQPDITGAARAYQHIFEERS